ncbi:origin recognition complex subunit 6-like isoform X2 [Dysidea avara]
MEVMARKLELSDAVMTKAKEYRRRADIKCSVLLKRYSDSCMCVVCLELASISVGAQFNKVLAAKLAGLSRKAYSNAFQSVEKLLQLQPVVNMRELSVKLGCVDVEPLASKILERYRQVVCKEVGPVRRKDLDLTMSKFLVAALYSAAKVKNVKVDKTKFLSAASCSRKEFQNVTDVMMENVPDDDSQQDKVAEAIMEETTQTDGVPVKKLKRERLQDKAMCSPYDEEYLSWKKRIITQAEVAINSHHHKAQKS